MKKISVLCILIISAIVACHLLKATTPKTIIPSNQKILFRYMHELQYTTYHVEGFYIDNQGNIVTYQIKDIERHGSIGKPPHSEEQLLSVLDTTSIVGEVEQEALRSHFVLIDLLNSDDLQENPIPYSNMGQHWYLVYQYDDQLDLYHPVVLQRSGNRNLINNTPEATEILTWLKEIKETNVVGLEDYKQDE